VTAASLALVCAIAFGCWLLLAAAIPVARLRARRRALARGAEHTEGWVLPAPSDVGANRGGTEETSTRALLERGLRSDEREVRVAAITTLSGLAAEHEWALDGLVEALASELETPERVATELDRLAPRPGRRLAPLVGHPSEVVRFYVVRLLGSYPELARRHVSALTADPSPHVRAAALETLRVAGSADTLRRALEMLSDSQPFVRAQASRTAIATAGVGAARFVAPLLADESWWVREAAREALVGAGAEVAAVVSPLVDAEDPALRKGAALVLQDVGAVDALVDGGEAVELERVLEAGGGRLRRAAAERARRRREPGGPRTGRLEQVS
jgi:hypothetical protein